MDNTKIKTKENLEAAFAGESMAFMKYSYFAEICRKQGFHEIAAVFEKTAKDEISHAKGHLKFLYPEDTLTPEKMLEISIAGETYEYTEMYPKFAEKAKAENNHSLLEEINEQIKESKEHADEFVKFLPKLEKLFKGLTNVEKHHANLYSAELDKLKK